MPSPHPSIVEALEQHALKEPNRPAFIFVNKTLDRFVLTRQQLWDYCRKFAGVLKRKQLGKGFVVCNTLRNSPQRLITELGAITSGAISMNGQVCLADGSDFVFSLNQGKASALILDPEDTKGTFDVLKSRFKSFDPASGEVSCPDVPSLKYILSYPLRSEKSSAYSFLEDLDKEEDMFHEDITPDDVCQYFCTSGTTSTFKLVALSSHYLLGVGAVFADAMGAKEDYIYLNDLPLGWLGGYPVVYLALGTCRVILDDSNNRPQNYYEILWKMACQEKCDICFTTPAALLEFNAVRTESDVEHVRNYKMRTILSGGGPVTKNHMVAALKNLSEGVSVIYGSTEAGIVSWIRVKEFEDYEEHNTGWPLPGVKVKVVDEEEKEVPRGQRGEILIQSNQAAFYYVNDPENTSRTFQSDGWIRLDDVGSLNDKGQLCVIGRTKFAIMRGTLIFYPNVIEGYIRNCPGVKDVIVTGVPDEKLNEEICAVIVTKPGEQLSVEDVKTFCENGLANKDLIRTPVPRYVLFVDEFPLGVTGKLDRIQIKKQACGMLNL